MKRQAGAGRDPGIEAALRRAAKRALRIGLETGTPVWVMERGQVIDLTREYRLQDGQPRRRSARRNGRSAE